MVQAGVFQNLQLSLWHLDPLRASAFVPLPNWIQTRRAVVNIGATGDDCFKWTVLEGMHSVDANAHRMSQYTEHVGKYNFCSLHFPVPLSSIGSFATAKLMYPLRVSFTLVPYTLSALIWPVLIGQIFGCWSNKGRPIKGRPN